ncbi:urease accessory protein UreD [Marinobacter sp. chi1]|uniref:Urease accessory protein UreD n=1 Tax=Marinobacter suaedae TaxID=3057675 RepID=A0ABT8VXI6_9GAMM|nr:urease accessory protein UreD [Marinobacter sp. chi1]MDO3720674.1 urease accessory protein UreD [Marinobacter sp. chi1]
MTAFQPIGNQEAANDSGHRFDTDRQWAASLSLGFIAREEGERNVTRLTRRHHQGPLRVQRPFYPEGPEGCCHVYLLHPPGGLVSGDVLCIEAEVGEGAHALLTTPAAAKLYKADSHGVAWGQHTKLTVAKDAILEYLPQETLAFDGSRGEQSTTIELQTGARTLGWEILALGRPASRLPFVSGHLEQQFRLTMDGQPLWLERQPLDPNHPRFAGKWGQGGATVQATLWAVGLEDEVEAIEAVREALPENHRWAITRRRGAVLLRYLGNERNEAWALCQQAWEILRPRLTGLEAHIPRIWLT